MRVMSRWPEQIVREVQFDVRFALTFKVGRPRRPLTDFERDLVAAAIVEHLQLANWIIVRGAASRGGAALTQDRSGNGKPE
jgi:hypothetical protein